MKSIDPNKVAIYVRWSTEEQGSGTTLETQLQSCKHFILANEWNINEQLIYVDQGKSGASIDRPRMNDLKKDVINGVIDCVVVYKLDRLSRNVKDTLNLVDEWDGKCALKSTKEQLDTNSPTGKLLFNILSSFAEMERDVIKDRTFSGKIQRAKQGKNPGFKAPYGYNNSSGIFEINPEESEIVKMIYSWYLSGKGDLKITYLLNLEKIPFRKNKPWNDSTVSEILRNPIYTGKMVYGRLGINHKHKKNKETEPYWIKKDDFMTIDSEFIPVIISDEIFEMVQNIRKSKNSIKKSSSGRSLSSPYLLSGIIKCQKCNHALTADKKTKNSFAYYRCRGKASKGKIFCECAVIQTIVIDKAVEEKVKERFLTSIGLSEIKNLIEKKYESNRKAVFAKKTIIENRIKEIDGQLKRLQNDYLNGTFSADDFNLIKKELVTERMEIIENLKSIKAAAEILEKNFLDESMVNYSYTQFLKWDLLSIQEKKTIIRQWVNCVYVYKQTRSDEILIDIEYKWNQPLFETDNQKVI